MDGKTHEPVVIANALLMALHTFFAGGVVVQGFIEGNESLAVIFAFGNLGTVALQAGLTAYQRGVVVPLENVVERVSNGLVMAGPANDIVQEGATVREVGGTPPAEQELTNALDSALAELKEGSRIYPESLEENDGPQ